MLDQGLRETYAEWYEANTAPLPIHFSDEIRTKLENIFGTYPSWEGIASPCRTKLQLNLQSSLNDIRKSCSSAIIWSEDYH
jgi:hypothetical protein